jgi:hypothetical protein
MESVSNDTIRAAVEILGSCEQVDDEVERRIRSLVAEDLTMRRLVAFIPEAFGWVVVSHLPGATEMSLKGFIMEDGGGPFPFISEPIFAEAVKIGQFTFHNGPRHLIRNIANRSAILSAASGLLDKVGSLKGCAFASCIALPASLYDQTQSSIPNV